MAGTKVATRRRTAKKDAPPAGAVVLTSSPETLVDRIPLFSIDGVEYTIPAKPRMNVGLKYLWERRERGQDYAIPGLLMRLLGQEGFEALMDYDELDPEEFQQIVKLATGVTLGQIEVPKGS